MPAWRTGKDESIAREEGHPRTRGDTEDDRDTVPQNLTDQCEGGGADRQRDQSGAVVPEPTTQESPTHGRGRSATTPGESIAQQEIQLRRNHKATNKSQQRRKAQFDKNQVECQLKYGAGHPDYHEPRYS